MAVRTRSNFKSTKNSRITTNGTGAITGSIMNDMFEDCADSFLMAEDGGGSTDIDLFYSEQTDFLDVVVPIGGFSFTSSGAGATYTISEYGVNTTENAIGVLGLETGTTTTGYTIGYHCGGGGINMVRFGTAAFTMKWRLAVSAVSDGTDTYHISFGFSEAASSSKDMTDGAYFTYTHSVNSGNWQAVTASASTRTTTNLATPPSTSFQTFEIRVNEAATEVTFYLNGTLVATHTTNIPTADTVGVNINIVKSAGTNERILYADYYYFKSTRSANR